MSKTTKFRFTYVTDNGERLHISREFNFADKEFYDNIEFIERFYGVRCRILVTE